MDVIFDIDGTLANAAHRLHFITDPDKAKDWENFLSEEQVVNDTSIEPVWEVLTSLVLSHNRILFITGRPEKQRLPTYSWLVNHECPHRAIVANYWQDAPSSRQPSLWMRKDGDRRPSSIVKEESLKSALMSGFKPKMVFEDRKDDTEMWRRNGLLCAQVAEGNY